MADKGHITIDELDKMGEDVQHALHEALADREVSVNKADINDVTLKARTSALMIANPVHGRFDEYEAFTDQFGIEASLLDRAALVVLFVDEPDEDTDTAIGRTVIGSHWGSMDDTADEDDLLNAEFMRKYIAHARREYEPVANEAAKEELSNYYATMRSMSTAEGSQRTVSIAPRALEGLINFAEAHARLRLSETVTVRDVKEAIDLFMEAYNRAGLDTETGKFSVDRIEGRSESPYRKQQKDCIREVVRELSDDGPGDASVDAVIKEVGIQMGDGDSELRHVIETMVDRGALMPGDEEGSVALT